MRVIFLDIDGVLNHAGAYREDAVWRRASASGILDETWRVPVSPECMTRLNELIAQTGAQIVISSSWRRFASWRHLGAALARDGLAGEVIGETPDLRGRDRIERGEEIAAWLVGCPDATSFAILDDDPGMGALSEFLVRTDPAHGLGDLDVVQAARLLARDPIDDECGRASALAPGPRDAYVSELRAVRQEIAHRIGTGADGPYDAWLVRHWGQVLRRLGGGSS